MRNKLTSIILFLSTNLVLASDAKFSPKTRSTSPILNNQEKSALLNLLSASLYEQREGGQWIFQNTYPQDDAARLDISNSPVAMPVATCFLDGTCNCPETMAQILHSSPSLAHEELLLLNKYASLYDEASGRQITLLTKKIEKLSQLPNDHTAILAALNQEQARLGQVKSHITKVKEKILQRINNQLRPPTPDSSDDETDSLEDYQTLKLALFNNVQNKPTRALSPATP